MQTSINIASWRSTEAAWSANFFTTLKMSGSLRQTGRGLTAFMCNVSDKCLRSHSYLSHMSNQEVLHRGKQTSLSSVLLRRQIKFYNNIAQLPPTSPLRQLTCELQGDHPGQWTMTKRRGRPKQACASCMFAARALAQSKLSLDLNTVSSPRRTAGARLQVQVQVQQVQVSVCVYVCMCVVCVVCVVCECGCVCCVCVVCIHV